jgi:cell division protein FtsB
MRFIYFFVKEFCMKRILKGVLLAIVAISLVLASCGGGGGNDPKSLAKQSVKCLAELKKATDEGAKPGDAKYDAGMKKLNDLTETIQKLSKEDQDIYNDELNKLVTAASK